MENINNVITDDKKKGKKKKVNLSIDEMITGLTQHISEVKKEIELMGEEVARCEIQLSELYNVKNNPQQQEGEQKIKVKRQRAKKPATE